MLNELQGLIPTEKETRLSIYIHQLVNEAYDNEKIETDSKKLLELLGYLTSDENISTQQKSAISYKNKRIETILHKREVENLKKYNEYLKKNSVKKQKIEDKINEIKQDKDCYYYYNFLEERDIEKTLEILEDLLKDKEV